MAGCSSNQHRDIRLLREAKREEDEFVKQLALCQQREADAATESDEESVRQLELQQRQEGEADADEDADADAQLQPAEGGKGVTDLNVRQWAPRLKEEWSDGLQDTLLDLYMPLIQKKGIVKTEQWDALVTNLNTLHPYEQKTTKQVRDKIDSFIKRFRRNMVSKGAESSQKNRKDTESHKKWKASPWRLEGRIKELILLKERANPSRFSLRKQSGHSGNHNHSIAQSEMDQDDNARGQAHGEVQPYNKMPVQVHEDRLQSYSQGKMFVYGDGHDFHPERTSGQTRLLQEAFSSHVQGKTGELGSQIHDSKEAYNKRKMRGYVDGNGYDRCLPRASREGLPLPIEGRTDNAITKAQSQMQAHSMGKMPDQDSKRRVSDEFYLENMIQQAGSLGEGLSVHTQGTTDNARPQAQIKVQFQRKGQTPVRENMVDDAPHPERGTERARSVRRKRSSKKRKAAALVEALQIFTHTYAQVEQEKKQFNQQLLEKLSELQSGILNQWRY